MQRELLENPGSYNESVMQTKDNHFILSCALTKGTKHKINNLPGTWDTEAEKNKRS